MYTVRRWKRPKFPAKTIKTRSFKNFNEEAFLNSLNLIDWNEIVQDENLDHACDRFNKILSDILDIHAPIRTQKIKGNSPQWINDELLRSIRERDFLKKKASKTKTLQDWAIFKEKRNNVNNLKKRLKDQHYNNKLKELKSQPKQLWKTLKELVPGNDKNKTSVTISKDGKEILNKKEISNEFNSFFANIGSVLAEKFSSNVSDINIPCNDNTFSFNTIKEYELRKIINDLKNDKATGTDMIGVKVLKAGLPVLSPILTSLFNKSLMQGYVPTCWKKKRISPLFKTGDPFDVNNYRPISILPVTMKVFEKIIHNQMSSFLIKHNILNTNQSGFRKLHSTSTAVTEVTDFILTEISEGKHTGAVLIDLKKAFDTVDHQILLKKMFCYGFQDISFYWLESYLSGRKQLTLINNTESDLMDEGEYGVPQGSVLGPLFFLLYINDIKSAIKTSYFHLYADDTIIIQSASSAKDLKVGLENELLNIKKWLYMNKLTLNTDKTEVIFFGNKRKLKSCNEIEIKYDNVPLKSKEKVKYLGVLFDNSMSWKKHIKNIVSKSYFKLKKIRAISSCLTEETKSLLVTATVMPYLNYCSTAWRNANPSIIKPANKLYSNINKFLNKPNQDVMSLLDFNTSITIFKAAHKICPIYLCKKVEFVKNQHCHTTRSSSSNKLVIKRGGSKFFNRTFSYSSPILWNSLPDNLRKSESILQFKVAAGKFFLNK